MKTCINTILFIIAITSSILAQNYPSAIDYAALMNMRFYEQSGGFMIETLPMIFPPKNYSKLEFEISDASGKILYNSGLRIQKWDNIKIFDGVIANGPGIVHLKQAGDFVISININGKAVTRLPFKMTIEKSNDPYNPSTNYYREGPWKNLGYFSFDPDKPDYILNFNWWTCLRELPANNKQAKITVHILKGNTEVAQSQSTVIASNKNWQPLYASLVVPNKNGTNWFTFNSLTKEDGNYSVVLKADDKPFKTFTFSVSGGKVKELKQNNIDYNPHEDFITPRILDRSSGSNSSYKILQACWVEAK